MNTKPAADEYGFVKTLNNQGFMTEYLDKYSQDFATFSAKAPGPSLDIGAAFGVATISALKNGGTVIANDSDPRHLEILKATVQADQNRNLISRLSINAGSFPSEIEFNNSSLGAVLACRVFHFFDGPTIQHGIDKIFGWLAQGGRFYLVGETPYVGGVQKFVPRYEERALNGEPWPGLIEDFQTLDPVRGKDLPKQMHLLDEVVLRRAFENAGFKVIEAAKFSRPQFPPNLRLDGRESVGIVGVKC